MVLNYKHFPILASDYKSLQMKDSWMDKIIKDITKSEQVYIPNTFTYLLHNVLNSSLLGEVPVYHKNSHYNSLFTKFSILYVQAHLTNDWY